MLIIRNLNFISGQSWTYLLKCPISELKRTKSILFRLGENDTVIFKGHEWVHEDEFEVYFEGVEFAQGETTKSLLRGLPLPG